MKPRRFKSDTIEIDKVLLAILTVLLVIDIIIGVIVFFDAIG
tara:strand:+ start:125 stop:250 length:126 start_codon:yes stop_codon:yes gene_type:complete